MTDAYKKILDATGRLPEGYINYLETGDQSGVIGDEAAKIVADSLRYLREQTHLTDTDPNKPVNTDAMKVLSTYAGKIPLLYELSPATGA